MEFDWQLLIHPPLDGGVNMAVDWWLLRTAERPTLRFYRWDQPTLSLGYRQQFDPPESLPDSLAPLPTVVRPTGGGYLLHAGEITYSLVVPRNHSLTDQSILDSYEVILSSFEGALREEGVLSETGRGEGSGGGEDCLASPARHEPTEDGVKWTASSQTRHRGRLLQHGSVFWEEGDWPQAAELSRPLFLKRRSPLDRTSLRDRLIAALSRDLFQGRPGRFVQLDQCDGDAITGEAERFRVTDWEDLPCFRRHLRDHSRTD